MDLPFYPWQRISFLSLVKNCNLWIESAWKGKEGNRFDDFTNKKSS